MLKFLKNWTLPIAMLVGAVGYPLFISLSFLTPYLIFTMLLLTFCKVSPHDLKPKPLHAWLLLIIAVLIPVLSYITQVINIKLMPTAATAGGDNDQMARQMKTMNTMMPLMSLFFCFVTPVGLGIYWVASALCRAVQQFFINKHIENLDLEDIIAKNQEKVKKKREKMGVTEERIRQAAAMNTRSIQSKANVSSANIEMEREKANAAKANAKPGSMAAKANLVKEFSEKNNRK